MEFIFDWLLKIFLAIIGYFLAIFVSKKVQKVIPKEKYFFMSMAMIGLVLIASLAAIATIFYYLPHLDFPINYIVGGATAGILFTFWISPKEKS